VEVFHQWTIISTVGVMGHENAVFSSRATDSPGYRQQCEVLSEVKIQLETVTPLFLGGADPRGEPELRAAYRQGLKQSKLIWMGDLHA
jgi:hypothetical protein